MRDLTAGLLALALVVAACGNHDGSKFDDAFRQSFMTSCTAGQPEAFCSCYLDQLEQRYTQDEIYAAVIGGSEAPAQEFIDAGLACMADLGG